MNNKIIQVRLTKSGLIHISSTIVAFTNNHRIKYKGWGKHIECVKVRKSEGFSAAWGQPLVGNSGEQGNLAV